MKFKFVKENIPEYNYRIYNLIYNSDGQNGWIWYCNMIVLKHDRLTRCIGYISKHEWKAFVRKSTLHPLIVSQDSYIS